MDKTKILIKAHEQYYLWEITEKQLYEVYYINYIKLWTNKQK